MNKEVKDAPKLYLVSVNCVVFKYAVRIQKPIATKTRTVDARTSVVSQTTTLVITQTVHIEDASTTLTETVSTTAVEINTASTATMAMEIVPTVILAGDALRLLPDVPG